MADKKWYIVRMRAEDDAFTTLELTDAEYNIISKFVNEVADNCTRYSGVISISEGFETLEEVQKNYPV